jgi:hypothetical protein
MPWDCKAGTPDEDHNWRLASDCVGDPGVINGIFTFYVMRCRECGEEREPTEQEIRDAAHNDYDY